VLHIFAVATTAGSSVSFSNLAFTVSTGLTTSGSLDTSGSIAASSTYDKWIAAPTGVNLDDFDWTFSGKVTLAINGTNPSSGEGIKFEFTGKNGEFTPPASVPEPSTLATMGLGAIAAAATAARRRRDRCAS
jgi:hypothetical protein